MNTMWLKKHDYYLVYRTNLIKTSHQLFIGNVLRCKRFHGNPVVTVSFYLFLWCHCNLRWKYRNLNDISVSLSSAQDPCSSPTTRWPYACWAAHPPPPSLPPPHRASSSSSSRLQLEHPWASSACGSLFCQSNTRPCPTATTEPCPLTPQEPEERPELRLVCSPPQLWELTSLSASATGRWGGVLFIFGAMAPPGCLLRVQAAARDRQGSPETRLAFGSTHPARRGGE